MVDEANENAFLQHDFKNDMNWMIEHEDFNIIGWDAQGFHDKKNIQVHFACDVNHVGNYYVGSVYDGFLIEMSTANEHSGFQSPCGFRF